MATSQSVEFRRNMITGAVAVATIAGLTWGVSQLLNTPFFFDFELRGWFLLFGILVVLAWFTDRSGELALGFTILSAALLLLVFAFLPDFLVDVFAAVLDPTFQVIGLETTLQQLINNSVALFILTLAGVTVGIAASKRLTGSAKKPQTIADATFKTLAKYIRSYARIARLVALLGVALFTIAIDQLANLSGEVGAVIAQAPFPFSNALAGIAGFLSLGGSLPIIGQVPIINDLSPFGFAVLVIVLMLAAASVSRRDPSGRLIQLLRR